MQVQQPLSTFCSSDIYRTLPPGLVNGILPIQNDLRYRHKSVSLLQKALNDPRKGLRRVERRVVEQHDGTRLYLGGNPLCDSYSG